MFIGASSFHQNLGPWFIVLDDTSVGNGKTLVADISAQVGFDTDIDNYDISGPDADDFIITGGQLVLNSPSDHSSKSVYEITIGANTTKVSSLYLNVEPSISASIQVDPPVGTPPTFSSAAYIAETGVLTVTFSEPISTTVDLSKLHARESGESSGGVTLTGASSNSVSGSTLTVTLSATQQSAVESMATPQLDIDAGAVSDTSSNPIAAAADRTISVADGTAPTFDSAAYSTGTGALTVTFSEPISTTVDLSKLHVRESGESSGGATLTGASSSSVSGSTLTVTLSATQQSAVESMATPQLDIDAGAVSDTASNSIAAASDQAISIADGIAPTFDSATYTTGTLAVTFSEPISTTVDLSKLHVRESGESSGGATLTGASSSSVSGSTLTVTLSATQQSAVESMATPQLDIDAGAVSDTSSNPIAAAADRTISVADGTAPTFDSAAYSTGTGALTVTFSEPISTTVDLSKLHVRESGESSGAASTLTGASSSSVSGSTLTVTLSATQQSAVESMATPQLDIDAGAVSDTSSNPIAAAADRTISVADGIAPTFDSAAYSTGTGALTVTFSEPISTTVDLSKLHVRESGESSGGVTLTGASSSSVSGSTLTVTLSATQQSAVESMATPQLDIDAGAVSDTSSNPIEAASDQAISVADGTAPAFDSAAYSTGTGALTVTFSEPISTTVDLSKLHVRESGESSGGVNPDGRILQFRLRKHPHRDAFGHPAERGGIHGDPAA